MISLNNQDKTLQPFAIAKDDKLTKLDPRLIGEILSFFPPSREEMALYATCRYTANRMSAKTLHTFARHPLMQSLIPGELPLNGRSDCSEILHKIERLVLWADCFSMRKSMHYRELAANSSLNFPVFINSASHCTWDRNSLERFADIDLLFECPTKRRKESSVKFLQTRLARITYDDLAIVLTLSNNPTFLSETNYDVFSAPIIDMLAYIHLSRGNSRLFNQLLNKSSLYDANSPQTYRRALRLVLANKAKEVGQVDLAEKLLPVPYPPHESKKDALKTTDDQVVERPWPEEDSGSESEDILPIELLHPASSEYVTL